MFRVAIHEHVSAEHLDGLLDELAEMGAKFEKDPDGVITVVPKMQDDKFIQDFLLQEDRRGNLTVLDHSNSPE